MRRTAFAPAAVAAVLLLAGCSAPAASGGAGSAAPSGAGASSASAAPPSDAAPAELPSDPCSVLTADEATKAYGGSITETSGETGCSYSGEGGGFLVAYSDAANGGWKITEYAVGLTGDAKAISGIGDRAVGHDGTLAFQKGSLIVLITSAYASTASEAPKVAAVAKAIAAKV